MNKIKFLITVLLTICILFPNVVAYTITGNVEGFGIGSLEGAKVTIEDNLGVEITSDLTDSIGVYTLDIPNVNGIYVIKVPVYLTYSEATSPQWIDGNLVMPIITLGPAPTITLSGVASDFFGNPLENVYIMVLSGGGPYTNTKTNNLGQYSIEILDNLNYDVQASLGDYIINTKQTQALGIDILNFDFILSKPCQDNDVDNYGAQGTDLSLCSGSTTLSDCDDADALIHPGVSCSTDCSNTGAILDANCVCNGGTNTCGGGGEGSSGGSSSRSHPALVTPAPAVQDTNVLEQPETPAQSNEDTGVTGAVTAETGTGNYVIAGLIVLVLLGIGSFLWKKYK